MGKRFPYLRARIKWTAEHFAAFAKDHVKGSAIALLVSAIGLAWLGPNASEMKDQLLQMVAYGIVGPLAVTGLAFFIFWFLAPHRIYREQHEKIARLSASKDDNTEQSIIDSLAELHDELNRFAFKDITAEGFDEWNKACEQWFANACAVIELKCSKAELLGFTGVRPRAYSFRCQISPEHNRVLCNLRALLDRLQYMIDQRQEAILRK